MKLIHSLRAQTPTVSVTFISTFREPQAARSSWRTLWQKCPAAVLFYQAFQKPRPGGAMFFWKTDLPGSGPGNKTA